MEGENMETLLARPVEILLVDDSISDIELMQEGLKEGKIWHRLSVVRDGAEAMKLLNREGRYYNSPEPDLILLDLNMPRKDGRQVLKEIKSNSQLAHIPVVVLTTSQAEQDILCSYQLHANSYITKPVGLTQFFKVVQALEDFWFTVVKLPKYQGTL
jgi:two-component system, chemotaxis family, response regulator Rcp1